MRQSANWLNELSLRLKLTYSVSSICCANKRAVLQKLSTPLTQETDKINGRGEAGTSVIRKWKFICLFSHVRAISFFGFFGFCETVACSAFCFFWKAHFALSLQVLRALVRFSLFFKCFPAIFVVLLCANSLPQALWVEGEGCSYYFTFCGIWGSVVA